MTYDTIRQYVNVSTETLLIFYESKFFSWNNGTVYFPFFFFRNISTGQYSVQRCALVYVFFVAKKNIQTQTKFTLEDMLNQNHCRCWRKITCFISEQSSWLFMWGQTFIIHSLCLGDQREICLVHFDSASDPCLKLGWSSKSLCKYLKWLLECVYYPSDLCIYELQYDHRVLLKMITESCIHTL